MKSTAKLIPIFIFLLFSIVLNFASAQEISNFQINIQISGLKSIISYNIQTDLNQITLNLPADVKIIDCSENYSLSNNRLIADISDDSFNLNYSTENFIENNKYFTADFKIPKTEKLDVRLILPEQATLEKSYPKATLGSDGRHIILNWAIENAENFPIFVNYNENNANSLAWILSIIITVALIIYFILKIKSKNIKTKKRAKSRTKKIEQHLLESEYLVIKLLKDSKGEMWQKQIQIKTGFSKAKLSRVIRNLESRSLLKKMPLGNTNKIKLK